ncbi:MAG: aldo/keto reductase [Saprospiraceae bacterium]
MKSSLSPIVSGVMNWGQWGQKLDTKGMSDLMIHFKDHGITTFDHADIYGNYTTEAQFGAAFKTSGIHRKDIQLISKCGIMKVSENKNYRVGHYSYTYQHIMQSCEQSLKNLNTDYLDVFLMHRPSPLMDPHVMKQAVTKLIEDGKILEFGVSNFTPSQTEIIRALIPTAYNQIEFSLTKFQPLIDGQLDHMMLHKIKPMAYAPLGSLFKEMDDQNYRISQVIHILCQKYDVEKDTLLLHWILRHPAGIIPVVGTTNPTRISRLPDALTLNITEEEWFELWEASMGHPVP